MRRRRTTGIRCVQLPIFATEMTSPLFAPCKGAVAGLHGASVFVADCLTVFSWQPKRRRLSLWIPSGMSWSVGWIACRTQPAGTVVRSAAAVLRDGCLSAGHIKWQANDCRVLVCSCRGCCCRTCRSARRRGRSTARPCWVAKRRCTWLAAQRCRAKLHYTSDPESRQICANRMFISAGKNL